MGPRLVFSSLELCLRLTVLGALVCGDTQSERLLGGKPGLALPLPAQHPTFSPEQPGPLGAGTCGRGTSLKKSDGLQDPDLPSSGHLAFGGPHSWGYTCEMLS